MKLELTKAQRDAVAKYPIYSQDGKRGDAVAVLRLFITGTSATIYIIEADFTTGELFGVSNMEKDYTRPWSYGYFSKTELEDINLYGGTVHVEADRDFEPTPLKDIPEVAEALADYGPMI